MATLSRAPKLKCARCRGDKVRCEPQDRVWPGRECNRCIQYHYNCGPNEAPPLRQVDLTSVQGPSYPATQPQIRLRCLHYLTDIDWSDGIGIFDAGRDPTSRTTEVNPICMIAFGFFMGEFSAGNSIVYRLWEREHYLESHQDFDLILQAKLRDNNPVHARSLATADYISNIAAKVQSRAAAEPGEPGTVVDIPGAVAEILRRGARWTSLVNAVGSMEILLLDQEQHIMDRNNIIGDVIEVGTDEQFEAMKAFIVDPENNVKDTCLRLSGVSMMIMDIADMAPDSDARQYVSRVIGLRIQEVLGDRVELGDNNIPSKIKIFNGYPQREIIEIFGVRVVFMPPEERDRSPQAERELVRDEHVETGAAHSSSGTPAEDLMDEFLNFQATPRSLTSLLNAGGWPTDQASPL